MKKYFSVSTFIARLVLFVSA